MGRFVCHTLGKVQVKRFWEKNGMFYKKGKGQSTVEYIILVTAVITVAIMFLINPGGVFQSKLELTMNQMANQMTNVANRLSSSFASQ